MFSPVRQWLLAALVVGTCSLAQARARFSYEELAVIEQRWPAAQTTTTGLRYVVLREGQGALPQAGDQVKVHYRGELFDGQVFDQTTPERPMVARLGRGQLIRGWEEGLAAMRVGEKRTLIVPSDLAYGVRGRPPAIPRQTSLIFEVELVEILPASAETEKLQPTPTP